MRRSGTTIFFDVFHEDPRFTTFYEPLSLARETAGGGSQEKRIDFNRKIRQLRKLFIRENNLDVSPSYFNYGAPTDYRLECSSASFDDIRQRYLEYLLEQGDTCLLKFTRATFLVDILHDIDPEGYFIHIVKHPIRWTASHIFKRDYSKYDSVKPYRFFRIRRGFNFWSQQNIANAVIRRDAVKLPVRAAYMKLLYVWKRFNGEVEKVARERFGSRYLPITHDPCAIILYRQWKNCFPPLMNRQTRRQSNGHGNIFENLYRCTILTTHVGVRPSNS